MARDGDWDWDGDWDGDWGYEFYRFIGDFIVYWGYEFYSIRILSSRAESISHLFASLTRDRYLQHSKIKFVYLRGHVISSMYMGLYEYSGN